MKNVSLSCCAVTSCSWRTGTDSTWWCARCRRCRCSVCTWAPWAWDKWCACRPGPDGCRTPRATRGSCNRTYNSVPPACWRRRCCRRSCNSTGETAKARQRWNRCWRPASTADGRYRRPRAVRSRAEIWRPPPQLCGTTAAAATVVDFAVGRRGRYCTRPRTAVVVERTSSVQTLPPASTNTDTVRSGR